MNINLPRDCYPEHACESHKAELDSLLVDVKSMDLISLEDVNLKKVFISIADTFAMFYGSFKANIISFMQSIKRSEIKMYVDSNPLKISAVEKLTYDKCMEEEVVFFDSTHNMLDCIDKLTLVFKCLNIVVTFKTNQITLNKAYAGLSKSENVDALLSSSYDTLNRQFKVVQTNRAVYDKLLKSNKLVNKPFSEVFNSMEDLRSTKTSLLAMVSNFHNKDEVLKSMDIIIEILKNVVTVVNEEDVVSSRVVKAYANYADVMANMATIYGEMLKAQATVEHCYTETINNLYQVVK